MGLYWGIYRGYIGEYICHMGLYWVIYRGYMGLYWGYTGIKENRMETTVYYGVYVSY